MVGSSSSGVRNSTPTDKAARRLASGDPAACQTPSLVVSLVGDEQEEEETTIEGEEVTYVTPGPHDDGSSPDEDGDDDGSTGEGQGPNAAQGAEEQMSSAQKSVRGKESVVFKNMHASKVNVNGIMR